MLNSSCVISLQAMEKTACDIGSMAYRALLEEVYTSPKPGLVDLYSPGAHKDMDVFTFERSAKALKPFFASMALEGMKSPHTPRLLFETIRRVGLAAERAMYKATDGVNTHKGLIFNMGILSAAAGACIRTYGHVTVRHLMETEQAMVRDTLIKEVEEMNVFSSNGEMNLRKYGTMGARGEAISGYASVCKVSLPVMIKGIEKGRDWNRIKLETLFTLMSRVDDSNIIARHDPGVLLSVQEAARDFLNAGGAYRDISIEILKAMDEDFIKRNISAGGCADLLAVTIFILELINEPVKRSCQWIL